MTNDVTLPFDMPDWAKYHAVDENGDFCVFSDKPFLLDEVPVKVFLKQKVISCCWLNKFQQQIGKNHSLRL